MQLNFDASKVAPAVPFEAVPTGWYTTMITATEDTPVQNNPENSYLLVEHTILLPEEFKGRKVFDRLNLKNSNPVASEIAYRSLSAICHAIGVIQVTDAAQLHNLPMLTKISLKPAGPDNGGVYREAGNDIKGYKAVGAGGGPASSGPGEVVLPAAIAGDNTPVYVAPVPAPVPAPTPAPAAPAAPAAPVETAFPPEGWAAHPTSPGWFYRGKEVLNEADLRATMAPATPATPAAPAAPVEAASGEAIPPWAQPK